MQSESLQDRRLVKTRTPGIYKRGNRYVVIFRDPQGRQPKRAAKTTAQARELKATLTADVKRGEYRTVSKVTFTAYAAEWIGSYQGRTSRGIRPETLADYRHDLGLNDNGKPTGTGAVAFFGRMTLAAIEPVDVKRYAGTLAARGLSQGSVRNMLAPVRALLASAYEDGVIRANPAARLRIVQRADRGTHMRDDALPRRPEREAGANVARASLARVHALGVRAPHGRRPLPDAR